MSFTDLFLPLLGDQDILFKPFLYLRIVSYRGLMQCSINNVLLLFVEEFGRNCTVSLGSVFVFVLSFFFVLSFLFVLSFFFVFVVFLCLSLIK